MVTRPDFCLVRRLAWKKDSENGIQTSTRPKVAFNSANLTLIQLRVACFSVSQQMSLWNPINCNWWFQEHVWWDHYPIPVGLEPHFPVKCHLLWYPRSRRTYPITEMKYLWLCILISKKCPCLTTHLSLQIPIL